MWRIFILLLAVATTALNGSELQDDIDQAVEIITDFQSMPEDGIPVSILRRAKGLAILNVVKAGFVWSGRVGRGIVIAKTSNGWSAPSAIGVGGAGFGFQIGVQTTDFVIVLNTQSAVDAFARGGNITLGGALSAAAGPVGRNLEADVMPMAAVYSYSRSQGLFAGVSLEGAVIATRNKANRRYYNKNVTARELLSGKVAPPKGADELYNLLKPYVRK